MLIEETIVETATPPLTSAPPPSATMLDMLFGKQVTYCLSAVARLGVPDHMDANDAIGITKLATGAGAHEPYLYRVMRMLSAVGVFEESAHRHFRLTPLGELLRTDAPGSVRYLAIQLGETWSTRSMEHFTDTLRTGTDSVTLAFGKNVFDYFAESPAEAEIFNRSMSTLSAAFVQPVLDGYDFSSVERLADVGGGHGMLLSAILERYPAMQGVVYDMPGVIAGAAAQPYIGPVQDRVVLEAGSFFERVPEGCDAYLLKFILHDWSDDLCRNILSTIRRQLPAHGRVLACEQLVMEDGPPIAKLLDMEMLAMTVGGRERTVEEFAELFVSAGLRLNKVFPTGSPLFILEAVWC